MKFEVGEIVWDNEMQNYGVVLAVYNDNSGEIRLDSDGNRPIDVLAKLGAPNDYGNKAQLISCLKSHKTLVSEWNYQPVNY